MASGFITTCLYTEQEEKLRALSGRQILAQYDDSSIVVYQTFCHEIADYAIQNGYFGGPLFDFNRMTWFKLSFLWTMSTSDWATMPGKERVLAIKMDRDHFSEVIETATTNGTVYQTPPGKVVSDAVTLLWKPDVNADGEQLDRHTLLIGLKAYMLQKFNNKYIEVINDITDFVREQRSSTKNKDCTSLVVPIEERFMPDKKDVCRLVMLDGFYETPEWDDLKKIIAVESLGKSKFSRKLVLFLQGSFNPVHTKHVQIMLKCKEWLEKNKNSTVTAGVMGVNSDELVADKIREHDNANGLVIKSCHRIKMCDLSVLSHDWIYVHDMGMGKPSQQNLDEKMKLKLGKLVNWLNIYGADRGMKMCQIGLNNSLIIGREGVTKKLEETYERTVMQGLVSADNVHVIPIEMENVNSTAIRRDLKRISCLNSLEDKRSVTNELIDKGWLDKNVGDYLVDNEQDLYEHEYKSKKSTG